MKTVAKVVAAALVFAGSPSQGQQAGQITLEEFGRAGLTRELEALGVSRGGASFGADTFNPYTGEYSATLNGGRRIYSDLMDGGLSRWFVNQGAEIPPDWKGETGELDPRSITATDFVRRAFPNDVSDEQKEILSSLFVRNWTDIPTAIAENDATKIEAYAAAHLFLNRNFGGVVLPFDGGDPKTLNGILTRLGISGTLNPSGYALGRPEGPAQVFILTRPGFPTMYICPNCSGYPIVWPEDPKPEPEPDPEALGLIAVMQQAYEVEWPEGQSISLNLSRPLQRQSCTVEEPCYCDPNDPHDLKTSCHHTVAGLTKHGSAGAFGTAVVIAPQYMLSAGHAFSGTTASNINVHFGQTTARNNEFPTIKPAKAETAPGHDLAVVKLREPLEAFKGQPTFSRILRPSDGGPMPLDAAKHVNVGFGEHVRPDGSFQLKAGEKRFSLQRPQSRICIGTERCDDPSILLMKSVLDQRFNFVSHPCKSDSGAPAFATVKPEIGPDELAITAIHISHEGDVKGTHEYFQDANCAPVGTFVDLTVPAVQKAIEVAMKKLGASDEDVAGVFVTGDIIPDEILTAAN